MRGAGDRLKPVPAPLRNPARAEIGSRMSQGGPGLEGFRHRVRGAWADFGPYPVHTRKRDLNFDQTKRRNRQINTVYTITREITLKGASRLTGAKLSN